MRLHCYECGKSVSSEVPAETVVRAALICPECIEKMAADGALRLVVVEEEKKMNASTWKNDADAATVDVTAARLSLTQAEALEHLRDARSNLDKAIEALEDEMDEDV